MFRTTTGTPSKENIWKQVTTPVVKQHKLFHARRWKLMIMKFSQNVITLQWWAMILFSGMFFLRHTYKKYSHDHNNILHSAILYHLLFQIFHLTNHFLIPHPWKRKKKKISKLCSPYTVSDDLFLPIFVHFVKFYKHTATHINIQQPILLQ